jgi:hypothetical protein
MLDVTTKIRARTMGTVLVSVFFVALYAPIAMGQEQSDIVRLGADAGVEPSFVRVSYSYDDISGLSGGQFQLRYDPAVATLVDDSACLSGLPETHQSNFSVCNVFPEKGIIQFVVLDLGRNARIGTDELGSLTFRVANGSASEAAKVFKIAEVGLAGPDGRHLETVSEESRRQAIQLEAVSVSK